MSNTQQAVTAVVPVVEPELIEYAKKHGLETVVQRLVEATQRVFPTALSIKVYLEQDVALEELWFVVFEVKATKADVPDYLVAKKRWGQEWLQIYPMPRQHSLILSLHRVES